MILQKVLKVYLIAINIFLKEKNLKRANFKNTT